MFNAALGIAHARETSARLATMTVAMDDVTDRTGLQLPEVVTLHGSGTRHSLFIGSSRLSMDTIRYDTIRDAILTCARKPT